METDKVTEQLALTDSLGNNTPGSLMDARAIIGANKGDRHGATGEPGPAHGRGTKPLNLVEHLKSPQFLTEDGRPTNRNRFARMTRVTAPGTPRWVGYVTGLAILVVGLLTLFAYPDAVVGLVIGLILIGSAVYIWLEVRRGIPFRSRDRIDYPSPGQPS